MNLKRLLSCAVVAAISATSFAATYAIWPAATEGEEQIPANFNYWWNFASEETNVDGIHAMRCWSANGSDAASSGWMINANTFDYTKIADLDLVFEARIDGPGSWLVRVTGGQDADATISIPRDGTFHTVRMNVKESFPSIYPNWLSGATNSTDAFPFALVGSGLNGESSIYFTNCRYESSVPMPSVTATVSDVTSNSARLSWDATFPEGYTNTRVMLDGEDVDGSEYVFNGLAPRTRYSHTVTVSGEYKGSVYSAGSSVEFTTPREEGSTSTWYGSSQLDGFSAEYSITYNPDKTLTVEATIETTKPVGKDNYNFHIYIGGDEWLKLYDDGSGVFSGTTTSTFEEGSTIGWEWYMPVDAGLYQEQNTYVAGSENEAPLSIRVSASVDETDCHSASISYSVTSQNPDYTVYYILNGGAAVKATGSPIKLSDLADGATYTIEIYAVTTDGDKDVESRHMELTFKTPAENAVDLVYSDLYSVELRNAFLIGEDETMRRSIFVTIPWSIVYKADGTAVYSADLSSIENVVGLVPQVWANHVFNNLTKNGESGLYEYNFGSQELDGEVMLSHYYAYSGGAADTRTEYTKWGMEKSGSELGEAVRLMAVASKNNVILNESLSLSITGIDEAGHYVASDDYVITVDGGPYTLDGNKLTLIDSKGVRHLTVNKDGLSTSIEVNGIASPESSNKAASLIGMTNSENVSGGTVENVTDSNLESQLEWRCNETEEHYFVLDLGKGEDKGYYIEAVEVLFEGAYASQFTVTLSNSVPAEISGGVSAYAAGDDVVFTNSSEGTSHTFVQDPDTTHRYVTLRTQKAFNTGYGIKLRNLAVHATDEKPSSTQTGVENVIVDNSEAPAEYYDLNGRRVANPSNGFYILRQGNKVSKVLVK